MADQAPERFVVEVAGECAAHRAAVLLAQAPPPPPGGGGGGGGKNFSPVAPAPDGGHPARSAPTSSGASSPRSAAPPPCSPRIGSPDQRRTACRSSGLNGASAARATVLASASPTPGGRPPRNGAWRSLPPHRRRRLWMAANMAGVLGPVQRRWKAGSRAQTAMPRRICAHCWPTMSQTTRLPESSATRPGNRTSVRTRPTVVGHQCRLLTLADHGLELAEQGAATLQVGAARRRRRRCQALDGAAHLVDLPEMVRLDRCH